MLDKKTRLRLLAIRAIFLVSWLCFSGTIFIIALLSNINWMRPGLEEIMDSSLHRNVKLGRLSWHFGFRGLSVESSSLLIAERTGDPFLMSGNCEIGFSLWPSFNGPGQIRYIDMQNPLFMAIRTAKKHWNFDDLLIVSPDIDFIQCRQGHVFVVDRASEKSVLHFPDTELNNVEIKLQRSAQFTPAHIDLSFDLPGQKPVAQMRFESAIWRGEKPWIDRKCHFQVNSKHCTLQNWQTLAAVFSAEDQAYSYENMLSLIMSKLAIKPDNSTDKQKYKLSSQLVPVSGKFDLNITADGVPRNKLNADMQLGLENLIFACEDKAPVKVPEVAIAGHLEIKDNFFIWKKFIVRIPDCKLLLNTSGQIQASSENNPFSYQGTFVGLLGDLKKLNPLISFFYHNICSDTRGEGIPDFENIEGKLFLDWRFANINHKNEYTTEAKMADINVIDGLTPILLAIGDFNKNNTNSQNTTIGSCEKYWQQLGLSQQAKFSGTIFAKSGQGLLLKDCRLEDSPINWKLSGQTDNDGQWKELIFDNQDLPLSKISEKIDHDVTFANQVKQMLGLSTNCQIQLDGKAKIMAKFSQVNQGKENAPVSHLTSEAVFTEASVKLTMPRLDIHHLNGSYISSLDDTRLQNIRFNTAGGAIEINANMPAKANLPLNFHLHANTVNFVDLRAVLQLFHLDTKNLDNWQMAGKFKELDLLIEGSLKSPRFALAAIPDDLTIVLPNTKQSIHASSGKIAYANDTFSLEKVNLSSQNSKALTTLVVKNFSGAAKLEKFSIVAESSDLANLQAYLSSSLMPAYYRNLFNTLVKKYQISNLTGNISASLELLIRHGRQNIEGTVTFNNVDIRCGERKLLFHGMKGNVNFVDDDLLFRDITGSIGDSTLSLRGRLSNYQSRTPQWHGELNAQVTSDRLNDIGSLIAPSGQITVSAKKTISIKIKCSHRTDVPFTSITVLAEPDSSLALSIGDLHIHQPAGKKLSVNGVVDWNEQQFIWRNLNLDFGGSSVILQGTMKYPKKGVKSYPILDCMLQIPDFMSTAVLREIFAGSMGGDIPSGQVKGSLSIQGPVNNLLLAGQMALLDVSLPGSYLNHISGSITFEPDKQVSAQPVTSSAFSTILQLQQLNLGPIVLSDVAGTLAFSNGIDGNLLFSSSPSFGADSQIIMNDLKATLGQGQLTASGLADLRHRKYKLDLNVKEANLAKLWPQITNSQVGVSGLLNCRFNLETYGANTRELEQNMSGTGEIHVGKGSFGRSAQLNARLNQVNLFHQGIFGFNVNNVLQSVLPPKSSEFNSIDGAFVLNEEILAIRRLLYDGRDMKFSAAGKANFALHSLELDVAGIMPRVSSSVIVGPIGELSREITLQKLFDAMTMHKLEKLPSLPVIGGLGNTNEIFTCRILAPYDQPKLISQSIEKSFHWIQNRPAGRFAKKGH